MLEVHFDFLKISVSFSNRIQSVEFQLKNCIYYFTSATFWWKIAVNGSPSSARQTFPNLLYCQSRRIVRRGWKNEFYE